MQDINQSHSNATWSTPLIYRLTNTGAVPNSLKWPRDVCSRDSQKKKRIAGTYPSLTAVPQRAIAKQRMCWVIRWPYEAGRA